MINRNNILLNPYDEYQCRRIVETFMPAIRKKFGFQANLHFEKIIKKTIIKTPRETHSIIHVPCTSFYYLNFVLDINPSEIVDIGCGMNFFKDIIPGIHGIDPDNQYADQIDFFDPDFIRSHQESFESAIAINSLHFCSIHDFSVNFTNFWETVKPGGRGYITFNTMRLVQYTSDDLKMSLFGTLNPTLVQLEEHFCNEIEKLKQRFNFLVIDVMIAEMYDEYMDGNIRLVFKK
jgi:hypothetical protein